jgi:hypothetical protein
MRTILTNSTKENPGAMSLAAGANRSFVRLNNEFIPQFTGRAQ